MHKAASVLSRRSLIQVTGSPWPHCCSRRCAVWVADRCAIGARQRPPARVRNADRRRLDGPRCNQFREPPNTRATPRARHNVGEPINIEYDNPGLRCRTRPSLAKESRRSATRKDVHVHAPSESGSAGKPSPLPNSVRLGPATRKRTLVALTTYRSDQQLQEAGLETVEVTLKDSSRASPPSDRRGIWRSRSTSGRKSCWTRGHPRS